MHNILNYWFESCSSNYALAQLDNMSDSFSRWFGRKEDEVQCTLWNISEKNSATWPDSAAGQIARVILYDQIPRGCFRGTAKAFAYEDQALAAANQFLGFAYPYSMTLSTPITLSQIQMALICLSHYEDHAIQQRSIDLSKIFSDQVTNLDWLSAVVKQQLSMTYSEAQQHYDVIACWGRFPHRNNILNRQSTAQEQQFLESDNLPLWMKSQVAL